MSRVLITGAAGFIGSHLADRLLGQGHEVIGLDSFTSYYDRRRKERNIEGALSSRYFTLVEKDLLDDGLGGSLAGTDVAVHLAAEPGVRASWGENFSRYLRRNVEATRRLLEALPRDLDRLVFVSSSSVYGSAIGPAREDSPKRPASPYGLSKLAAEELVRLYARERGMPVTVVRPFTVYGPRQRPEMALSRFISAAVAGRPLRVFGDGEQIREMTYVSDVVDALAASMEAPTGTYNVGGGSRATVNELVDRVRYALGTEVRVEYGLPAKGDVRSTWADLTRAGEALGYEPRVALSDGIEAQVGWALGEGRFAGACRP